MNLEIRKRWAEALRSGHYRQGYGRLHAEQNTFCCLGVLCDIAYRDGVVNRRLDYRGNGENTYIYGVFTSHEDYYSEDESSSYLPEVVMEWAEFDDNNPQVDYTDHRSPLKLADLNDQGTPFEKIAVLVEEQL